MNEPSDEETFVAPFAETTYEVSNNDALNDALTQIAASAETEATIVLMADVTAPVTPGGSYTTTFGVDGKHITVKSDEGGRRNFPFNGMEF